MYDSLRDYELLEVIDKTVGISASVWFDWEWAAVYDILRESLHPQRPKGQ